MIMADFMCSKLVNEKFTPWNTNLSMILFTKAMFGSWKTRGKGKSEV